MKSEDKWKTLEDNNKRDKILVGREVEILCLKKEKVMSYMWLSMTGEIRLEIKDVEDLQLA